MTRLGLTKVLSAVSLLSVFSAPALALDWSIKDLGNLGGDDQHSANIEHLAMGINNQGQVVGWSITSEREYRGELVSFMSAFVSAPNGGPLTNLANVLTFPHGVESPGEIEESSYATSINVSGIAVIRASRWHGLQSTLTSAPPYTHAYPIGPDRGGFLTGEDINNAGQVAGYNATPAQAFISSADRTTYQNIEWETGSNTYGTGINESGQVSLHTLNEDAAFIWSQSEGLRPLDIPAGGRVVTAGINDAGQIAGSVFIEGERLGFITGPDGEGLLYLDTLGGSFTHVTGLNNLGQVVGHSQTVDGLFNAFFTGANGQGMTNLSLEEDILNAGWSNIRLAAINDLGQIAGTGDHNGVRRPFLLTPVPEPETYAMMLAGLSMLGFMRRRRHPAINQ